MVVTVMDLAIGPHVGMPAIGMLHVPTEFLQVAARRRGMGDPFIPVGVKISILRPPWWPLQPIPAFRRYEWMRAVTRKEMPWVFRRPVRAGAHQPRISRTALPETSVSRSYRP